MIRYQTTLDNTTSENLRGFFVGWPNPPSAQTHRRILDGSDHLVMAIDDGTGNVVGFITAVSDGILSAYIPLLEVLPEYQGRGIGKQLVHRMLRELDGLYMVDLVCDEKLESYYTSLGLQPAFAMVKRDFSRQSGREDAGFPLSRE